MEIALLMRRPDVQPQTDRVFAHCIALQDRHAATAAIVNIAINPGSEEMSTFSRFLTRASRSLSMRASVPSSEATPLLSGSVSAPPMLPPPERLKALAPPVETPVRPMESSALVSRPRAQSQMVPYGHKFVPIQDKHRTGMEPDTIADTVIPKGSKLTQMQVPGGPQGEWYSPKPGQTPQQLGISPIGMMRVFEMGPGTPLPPTQLANGQGVMLPGAESWVPALKRATTFEALTDVPAVSSVSKPIVDTWSLKGVPVPTSGGGQQLLSPFRSRFRAVSSDSAALSELRPPAKTSADHEE